MFEQPKVAPRAGGKQKESYVNDAVKAWARLRPDITIFRNNVGALEWAPGRWLRYGLCVGSSDFIGWQSVVVTPEMLGKRVAVLVALECKTPEGMLTSEQSAFIQKVREAGGKSGVVRDVADAENILK